MPLADPQVIHDYTCVLERAILVMRMRIRYDDNVTMVEVHDLLDAIHNIPTMLRDYGKWFVPENMDADLARYDDRWLPVGNSKFRMSLLKHLATARSEDDDPA